LKMECKELKAELKKKPSSKKKSGKIRGPTEYNIFMKNRMNESQYDGMSATEKMKKIAKRWRDGERD
jgi:hypothetical protein